MKQGDFNVNTYKQLGEDLARLISAVPVEALSVGDAKVGVEFASHLESVCGVFKSRCVAQVSRATQANNQQDDTAGQRAVRDLFNDTNLSRREKRHEQDKAEALARVPGLNAELEDVSKTNFDTIARHLSLIHI